MQPLCNYVSTHVQSREKGGLGERETQYLAKSTGKSAQVINPGRGHLTELVEAMPFNLGYILSPREERRKGLSPQNLWPQQLLFPQKFLSHFKSIPKYFSSEQRVREPVLSPRLYGDSTGLSLRSHRNLHSLCSYVQPQVTSSILNSQ